MNLLKRKQKSIQTKFMMIVGALLIISSLITNKIILSLMEKQQYKEIVSTLGAEVKGISTSIDYLLKSEILKVEKYIYEDKMKNFVQMDLNELKSKKDLTLSGEQKRISALFKEDAKDEYLENEYLMNQDGTIIAIAEEEGLYTNVSSREYFQSLKSGNAVYISDIIKSNETGHYIIVIARAIYGDKGEFIGAIGRDVVADLYTPLLKEYSHGERNAFLLDANGKTIYDENKDNVGSVTGVEEIDTLSHKDSTEVNTIYYKYGKEDKLAVYTLIPSTKWSIYSTSPMRDIKAPIRKAAVLAQIILALVLFISIIITYYLSKSFTNPIKKLTHHMSLIAEGNLKNQVEGIHTKDETEQLASEMNETIKNLSQIITSVKASALTVNEQVEKLSGISEEVTASNIEITQAMNEITERTCDAASQVEECKNETNELEKAIDEVKDKNEEMVSQNSKVLNSLEESNEKLTSLIHTNSDRTESFNGLKETVKLLFNGLNDISKFLENINNINRQINLLSLNAAIEAARAGEAGKGFSVVSNEIKNLSNATQETTENISSIIHRVNELANQTGENLVNTENLNAEQIQAFKLMETAFVEMQETLSNMIHTAQSIYENVNVVNDKKIKVLETIEEVVSSTQQIAAITEEVTASITEQQNAFENVNTSAEGLGQLSEGLSRQVDVFKI